MPPILLDVDPRALRVSPQRLQGADPFKLARQIARFGKSVINTPVIQVWRAADGELVISDGMTRATRIAKLLPGQTVRVEVTDDRRKYDARKLPRIGDVLP
jgi:hypothetical protein